MKSIFIKIFTFMGKHHNAIMISYGLLFLVVGVFVTRESLALFPEFPGTITKDRLVVFAKDIFALGASVGFGLCFIFEPITDILAGFIRNKLR